MLISQVSNMSGRAQGFLAKMLEIAPIFQYAQFKLDPSTFLSVKDSDTFSGSAARAEGSAIQKDAQTPTTSQVSLAMYGREITIDEVRILDRNVGLAPQALKLQADRRLGGLAVKLAYEIQEHILKGSAVANQMLGLGVFVADEIAGGQTSRLGFTQAELASMNERIELKLDNDNDNITFVETLYKSLAQVPGANVILVNTNLAARLTTIAKKLGAAGETVNSFGTKVSTFNNVPIVALPTSAITQTESNTIDTDCTSLYIVRFAEELGTAISTNSGFYFTDFINGETYPEGKARLQFFLNLAVERTDAIKRLSRIRL